MNLERVGQMVARPVVPFPALVEYLLAEAPAAHRVSEARQVSAYTSHETT
jgi:hypothetical protein